jgi:hypothetical protein
MSSSSVQIHLVMSDTNSFCGVKSRQSRPAKNKNKNIYGFPMVFLLYYFLVFLMTFLSFSFASISKKQKTTEALESEY